METVEHGRAWVHLLQALLPMGLHAGIVAVLMAAVLCTVGALAVRHQGSRGRHPDDYFLALTLPVAISLPIGILTASMVCCYNTHVVVDTGNPLWRLAGIAVFLLLTLAGVQGIRGVRRCRHLEASIMALATPPSERLETLVHRLGIDIPVREVRWTGLPSVTLGRMRPWIVMSSDLVEVASDGELEAILCHEASHVCHRDNLKRLVSSFSLALLVWLPAARWLHARWSDACETCCDDTAVRRTGQPLTLASAILKEAHLRQSAPLPMVSCMVPGSQVKWRVRRLLDAMPPGPSAAPWLVCAAVTIASVGAFAFLRAHHWVFAPGCLLGHF